MKCPKCQTVNKFNFGPCEGCGANLAPEPARSDADSVRVQRMVSLAARWRADAETMDDLASDEPDDETIMALECRERSRTLRDCAAMLEKEWAGSEANKV